MKHFSPLIWFTPLLVGCAVVAEMDGTPEPEALAGATGGSSAEQVAPSESTGGSESASDNDLATGGTTSEDLTDDEDTATGGNGAPDDCVSITCQGYQEALDSSRKCYVFAVPPGGWGLYNEDGCIATINGEPAEPGDPVYPVDVLVFEACTNPNAGWNCW